MGREQHLRFWTWFERAAASVTVGEPSVTSELSEQFEHVGITEWQIYPSGDDPDTLVLSIGLGDAGPSSCGAALIGCAPMVSGWKFQVGHPRKHLWDGHVLWGAGQVPVDMLSWRFLVFRYPDGMHEIALVRPLLEPAIADQAEAMAIFAVEAELGQPVAEQLVCKITVDDDVSPQHQAMLISLKDLRKAVGLAD